MTVLLVRGCLLAAGALLLAGCGATEPPRVADQTFVTEEEPLVRMHEAPSVLVDRADPDRAYMAGVDLANSTCTFATSADGGRTWEERDPPHLEPYTQCGYGSANPTNIRTRLVQGRDGTLFYLFQAHDPDAGGARSVLLGRSSDRGGSWDVSVVHSPGAATPGEAIELNFVANMAVDADDPDRVAVIWRRSYDAPEGEDAPPTRAWLALSEDGGETFGEPSMMIDKDIGFEAPKIELADGRLFAFYRVRPDEDGADDVVTAGVSDDDGATWDETVIAEADDVSEPVVAHDHDAGVFHAVWHDNTNGDLDAFHARASYDLDWTEPVRLNDDEVGNRVGQFYPVISIAPGGRLDVAWYDYRDDPHAPPSSDEGPLNLFNNMGKHQTVYLASSVDGGQTWPDNTRVSETRIDRTYGPWDLQYFTQVPPAVASSEDRALVAWSDTQRGDSGTGSQDLAAARVDFGGGEVDAVPMVVVGALGLLVGAGGALVAATLVVRRQRRVQAA